MPFLQRVTSNHLPASTVDPAPHTSARARVLTGALLGGTMLLGVPAIVTRLSGAHPGTIAEIGIFGLGILTAAFILGSAAEAAQKDISRALALAFLAFIAVLPEYAVDLYFAWRAGEDIQYAHYAAANMTGGNRLLVGLGWPMVLAIFYWRGRRASMTLYLPRRVSLEVTVLAAATVYSFVLPLKGDISLADTAALGALFVLYLWLAGRHPVEEPELEGPAEVLAGLPTRWRRLAVAVLFLWAGGVILASSEPFAEALVRTGEEFGIDEFLLVQWLAPLASESPEFLAAGYLVYRGAADAGMTALISSKVNQWTLLIASLPVAFAVSSRSLGALPMDARQTEEVFLTAAQSAFALTLLLQLRLSPLRAIPLAGLFLGQLVLPESEVRYGFAFAYLALALLMLLKDGRHLPSIVRWSLMSEHPPG